MALALTSPRVATGLQFVDRNSHGRLAIFEKLRVYGMMVPVYFIKGALRSSCLRNNTSVLA
jgi:hypothetical protein